MPVLAGTGYGSLKLLLKAPPLGKPVRLFALFPRPFAGGIPRDEPVAGNCFVVAREAVVQQQYNFPELPTVDNTTNHCYMALASPDGPRVRSVTPDTRPSCRGTLITAKSPLAPRPTSVGQNYPGTS